MWWALWVACQEPTGAGPPAEEPTCVGDVDHGPVGSPGDAGAALEAVIAARPLAGLAVGVAVGEEVLWREGFGVARPLDDDPAPATADTPFAVASVTKTFVAVLIMQLVEEGLIALDEPLVDQAPALSSVVNPAHPDVAITPRHLLTHTATITDPLFTFDATYATSGDATMPMRDFVIGAFDPESAISGGASMWLPGEPGAFSCYSNMGVAVLAVLAEEVTGQGLEALFQERIFRPLGMTHSSLLIDATCDPDRLAQGVRATDDGFVGHPIGRGPQPEGHPELASGMLRTSAHDLLRFTMAIGAGGALDGQRILAEATVDEMLRRQLDPGGRSDPAHQALLWTHFPDADGRDWTGHYGGMNGFTASMWFVPGDDLRYVVLMNQLDSTGMNDVEVALLESLAAR
jgi:CubicO group peptidase (beta-lactamase class C family)